MTSRRLPRLPHVSSGGAILAASVFVAAFSNGAFFSRALETYGTSADGLLFMASLCASITAVLVLLLSAVCHRFTVKPVIVVVLLLSALLAYFSIEYGTIFDSRMIANVMQTDTAEAFDLFNPKLALYFIVLGLVPALVVYCLPIEYPHWKTETIARLKLAGGAAAVLLIAVLPLSGSYASLIRERHDLVGKVNPAFAIYSTVKLAVKSAPTLTRPRTLIGQDAHKPPQDHHREIVIMVVGEAARADHWSLNGYSLPTNPRLAREKVVNFPDFWSCGTSTAVSVPCMFSRLGRAHFDTANAASEDNALDILKRSGISVLWRDNNSSSKGVADRVNYQDFKTPQSNPVCDDVECRDEGMLHGLEEYIAAQQGDVLIVLHQMGNHGPAYHHRYPKSFEQFTPVCRTSDLGACTPQEISNAYDNAILYTDYFLAKVIELLKRYDDRDETAMLYVSDHGESLGEYGVYLHGLPYALAPDAQKHVPAVMWLGRGIEHDLRLETMEERRTRRWSHDNIFATLLGLFEVASTAYDPRIDLLIHDGSKTAQLRTHPPALLH